MSDFCFLISPNITIYSSYEDIEANNNFKMIGLAGAILNVVGIEEKKDPHRGSDVKLLKSGFGLSSLAVIRR